MKERIFDWVGGTGIILSLLIAIAVAFRTFLHPVPGFPASPYDLRWAIIYAALFILSLILFRHKSGFLLIISVAGATAILLFLPLIAKETRWAMLCWFVLIVLFASVGAQILRWFFPIAGLPLFDRWLVCLVCGMGVMAVITLGLGVAGLYFTWLAWGMISLLLLLTWKSAQQVLLTPTLQWSRSKLPNLLGQEQNWVALACGFLFIGVFGTYFWALTPAIRYDALSYHLAAPAIYIRTHGIVEIAESFNTYWAHYADMLYTLAMLLAGQPLPGLLHFSASLICTGLVFSLTRRLGSIQTAWIAMVLFCYVPIVSVQAGVAYIDLFTTLFVLGAVYIAIGWYQYVPSGNWESYAWLALCGGFTGLAIGVKLAALPVIIPLIVLLGFGIIKRTGLKQFAPSFFWWCLPAILFVMPWLLRDWLWTGNPIYPLMDNLFQGSQPVAQSDLFAIAPLRSSSVLDYLLLPWILTVNASRYYHETPGGVLAAIPLLALPWSYWRRRRPKPVDDDSTSGSGGRDHRRLAVGLWLACLAGSILTFFSAPNIRYLFPLLAILCSLAALNLDLFLPKIKTWLKLPFILTLAVGVIYLYSTRLTTLVNIPQYMPRFPVSVGLGIADRQKFLSERVAAYGSLQYLNTQDITPKVLSLGNEFRLYTTAKIYGTIFSHEARQILAGNPDPETLAKRLADAGFDYILINEPEMATSPLYALGQTVTRDFLRRYTRLVFSQNQVDIYRFYPQGIDQTQLKINMILNPGFETSADQTKPVDWKITGVPVYDSTGAEAKSGMATVRVHGPQASDPNSPEQNYSYLAQDVPVQPGQIYTASYWVRPDTVSEGYIALQVSWLDKKGQVIGSDGVQKKPKPGWVRYQMHAQAPPGAAFARFFLLVSEDQAVWFDDVCFAPNNGCP